MHRRSLLATAGAGIGSLAGCSGVISSDGDGGNGSAPVYGEETNDQDQELRLQLTVVEDGQPLADEAVIYHDYGGSYDRLEGTTGEDGELVFVDSMGPPPCNPVEVEVPDHDRVATIGCHNGGKELEETVDVANDA